MINLEDSNTSTNVAHVCGEIIDGLKFSHRTYGEVFYTFEIGVLRNSGYEDQIIVMASERIEYYEYRAGRICKHRRANQNL